ncbi:hypothetical protein V6N13_014429 [Hibiscus sabdariffa]|uniref:Uncharacterized protein n=1 Tax=Hibiscus sabdariffa TaxID=183260 RepID=A0ABR2RVJ8_9ROSI
MAVNKQTFVTFRTSPRYILNKHLPVRITWLEVQGLLLHAWNEKSFGVDNSLGQLRNVEILHAHATLYGAYDEFFYLEAKSCILLNCQRKMNCFLAGYPYQELVYFA